MLFGIKYICFILSILSVPELKKVLPPHLNLRPNWEIDFPRGLGLWTGHGYYGKMKWTRLKLCTKKRMADMGHYLDLITSEQQC